MRAFLCALAFVLCGPAQTATIWNEATDGDLAEPYYNSPTLNFSLGINRIIGEAHYLRTQEGWSDWDNDEFRFTIPDGANLRAITLRFSILDGANSSFLQPGYQISEWAWPYPVVLELPVWLINEQDPSLVTHQVHVGGLELAAPQYVWNDRGILSGYGTRWAYRYDFLVSAVPLPGTLALLLLPMLCNRTGNPSFPPR